MNQIAKKQFFNTLKIALSKAGNAKKTDFLTPHQWAEKQKTNRQSLLNTNTDDAKQSEQLIAHLRAQSTTVREVKNQQDIPNIVMEIQQTSPAAKGSEAIIYGDNSFIENLPWPSKAPLKKWQNSQRYQQTPIISMSIASAAASETGTLFLCSSNANPTPLNFLSASHITLLARQNIYETYEQAYYLSLAAQKATPDQPPRTINMISGPSRTADIEQILTLGAHGPIELHVIIYE